MEIEKLLDELYSYSMHGIKLGLENIKTLCKEMGEPQKDYKVIHVAGTNGKGSTSTTIETILLEAGYRVGKYTSPHILKFNERIRANGQDITDEDIVKYYQLVKDIVAKTGLRPTFFEMTTAMMFKYFSDLKLDYVVLETGMGGRFDATNVCEADICVITNVGLDHIEYLGDTIYKIAKEKAGIIKNCPKVIVADSNSEFLKAISEEKAEIINVLEKYKDARMKLDFKKFVTRIEIGEEGYDFSLFGDYQFKNFLTAYEVVTELGIDREIIKKACKKVVWQCRFERYLEKPLVILDGAHNEDGMRELCKIIEQGYRSDEVVIITSILKDKDVKHMLKLMRKISDNIVFTSLEDNPRGTTGEKILEQLEEKRGCLVENDMKKAYEIAKNLNKKIIVVCGSFYTLSKFKEEIDG
ncbi:MAG: bifunctional folylpolyglutamate synthase/dihydrofolate synthase [Candidatus Fusobacterium pullicola]|uniref:Dihydrofolate synthase/folylpolyglutamate synthase n=1 Tax=Candidatus Fusobacterium pullicola TaxID=2838601 RepID=A0A9E2KXU2_9FUSO|nr:folylpolyglutamate synthase/dihydrofolate synthase family protein [uncultured Fusobacterium sp.]MBM6689544.1 bifunctional folylpolyglutamate synthase/dihydrofolate synthase [Fusobacterium mortiferum]MBU3842386.1 bifunctional folylpolyglutamate synthase/dihydrofolate synthase [Candidatus Fusobacterium pullicola]